MSAKPRPNVIRRTLLWWYRAPTNPYVTTSFVVDFSYARAWLGTLGAAKVPINALIAGAITRVLVERPQANAKVVGRRIVPMAHIGIAMPVNLVGHEAGSKRELGMVVVPRAETRTLLDLANTGRSVVSEERKGKVQNPLIRGMFQLADHAPDPVVGGVLRAIDRASRSPRLAPRLHEQFPLTTALSNAGAAIGAAPGVWFRSADVGIPQRLAHVGTFWGVGPVQDEVVPVDGVPAVRPMLPVVLMFDHRLVDGVAGARLVARFAEICRDPAAVFGPTGEKVIGEG
jgi:pyruvate/2-oxoglutarate dehydrogenase complex dihydrolipoamide acyltransferase (E2) component